VIGAGSVGLLTALISKEKAAVQVGLEVTSQKLYSGTPGALSWIEQRPLSQSAEAFGELNKGQGAAPRVILYTCY